MSAANELRDQLNRSSCLLVPDAHDVMTAQLVEAAGFDAVYVGSFGSGASRWGVPDQSLLSLSQLIDHFRAVAERVTVPVLVDLEDGGANAVNVHHSTIAAERAGIAGIQIEDQVPGKLLGVPGRLYPLEVAADRIRVAVDARTDPDTVIIGRTEAISVGSDREEAFERCAAYAAAGADLVTCSFLPDEQSAELADKCGVPVAAFVVGTATESELASKGISMAIYPMQTALIAYREIKSALEALRSRGESLDMTTFGALMTDLMALQDGPANAELAETHHLNTQS